MRSSPPSLCRSTLFAQFEGDTYLLYGLGDGQLVNYRWVQASLLYVGCIGGMA